MKDLEMLEAAARAAGAVDVTESRDAVMVRWSKASRGYVRWNPRDDDGDSRRLEVKLKLEITWDFDRIDVLGDADTPLATEYIYDNPPTDVYAATRLAVLRAAAAIGGYREAAPG